jgi:hypothetical protein
MNCEVCHELISDFLDGSISREDQLLLDGHLEQCVTCAEVRNDLNSIVVFSRSQQGEYAASPNERAMWVRIRNVIEAEGGAVATASSQTGRSPTRPFWDRLMGRSWQFSFPQLAASVAVLAVAVALVTVIGVRGIGKLGTQNVASGERPGGSSGFSLSDNKAPQQQAINYWNARVEMNKARWSPQMRDTFDRNLGVIDQAVNNSLQELGKNPHDEVSEEMLNSALNEKIALLKEFSEL